MRLKKIVFNQVENEDTDYNIRVFLSVEKMAYVETPLYYYYQRQGSIVRNQQYQNLHIINAVLHYFDYLDYIPQEKYVIRKECIKRLFKNYLSANYFAKSTKDTVIITYFKEKLDGMDVKILKSISSYKALPFYMKLFMTLLLKMPFFYYLFRKTMEIKAKFY